MTAQPIGPRPVAQPMPSRHFGSSTYNSSYLLAGVRAGLVALALLTVLAVVVLL